jgi:hypothetical protein
MLLLCSRATPTLTHVTVPQPGPKRISWIPSNWGLCKPRRILPAQLLLWASSALLKARCARLSHPNKGVRGAASSTGEQCHEGYHDRRGTDDG